MWLLWSLFNDKILLLLFIIFAIINYFCNNNDVLLCIFIGKLILIFLKVIYMVSPFVLLSFSHFRAWVPGFPCPWRLPLFATNTHWDLYRDSPQSKVRKKIDSLMWIRDWEEKTGQKGREQNIIENYTFFIHALSLQLLSLKAVLETKIITYIHAY